jgi:hypothetical protein
MPIGYSTSTSLNSMSGPDVPGVGAEWIVGGGGGDACTVVDTCVMSGSLVYGTIVDIAGAGTRVGRSEGEGRVDGGPCDAEVDVDMEVEGGVDKTCAAGKSVFDEGGMSVDVGVGRGWFLLLLSAHSRSVICTGAGVLDSTC